MSDNCLTLLLLLTLLNAGNAAPCTPNNCDPATLLLCCLAFTSCVGTNAPNLFGCPN